MMRVLLSGASGFIGGHAARVLAERGHELRLLARPSSDLSALGGIKFTRAEGDLEAERGERRRNFAAACEGIDCVIHCAARLRGISEAEFADANAEAAGDLARAAASAGAGRFVLLSSLAALGVPDGDRPEPPDTPVHPVSAYGRSKAAGEAAVLAAAGEMAVSIVRPPLVYGPGDRGLLPFFQMASRGFIARLGDGSNRIAAVYGPDLAAALALVAESPGADGIYHASDEGGPYTWNELIDAISQAAGRSLRVIPLPGAAFEGMARLAEAWARASGTPPLLDRSRVIEMRQPAWLCDPSALTDATGWRGATDIHEGAAAAWAWYRNEGWI